MRITVLKIGRVAYPEIKALAAMYDERLRPFAKVEGVEAKDDAQAAQLLKTWRRNPGEHPLILLDERGKQLTSTEFAGELQRLTDDPGVKSVTFVVGGPMGHPEELKKEARLKFALSKATFTSDMAWLLLWEQLYRAFNIQKGTGYHHD